MAFMKDPKNGVGVLINGKTAIKLIQIIKKTRRTFTTEVNIAVEEYADRHELLTNKKDK